jgi:hypothetical protein
MTGGCSINVSTALKQNQIVYIPGLLIAHMHKNDPITRMILRTPQNASTLPYHFLSVSHAHRRV